MTLPLYFYTMFNLPSSGVMIPCLIIKSKQTTPQLNLKLSVTISSLTCKKIIKQKGPHIKARNKKNFGSGQLIFENWSGGPVDLCSFF